VIGRAGKGLEVLAPPPQLSRTAKAESVQASFVIRNMRILIMSRSPSDFHYNASHLLNRERRSRGMLYRSQRARDRDRVIASPECLRFRYHRWAGGLEDQAGEHQTGTAQGQES